MQMNILAILVALSVIEILNACKYETTCGICPGSYHASECELNERKCINCVIKNDNSASKCYQIIREQKKDRRNYSIQQSLTTYLE